MSAASGPVAAKDRAMPSYRDVSDRPPVIARLSLVTEPVPGSLLGRTDLDGLIDKIIGAEAATRKSRKSRGRPKPRRAMVPSPRSSSLRRPLSEKPPPCGDAG